MEQRRVILFLVLSFLVLIVHGTIFAPPRQPEKQLPPQNAEQAEAKLEVLDEEPEASPPVDAAPARPDMPAEQIAEPAVDVPLEYVTLGSVDENSPYRLLATFTNQGAGVRRVELASPKYRDLQDRGGYLGHMELVADASSGLLVQVVGAGTPAADAGVQVGDRLVSLGYRQQTTELNSLKHFHQVLAKTKPRRKITLEIVRGDRPTSVEATLGRRPLEVIRPEFENVSMRSKNPVAKVISPPSFQFTFDKLGGSTIAEDAEEIAGVTLRDSNWKIADRNAESVTFRQVLPQHGVEVLKRYRLKAIPNEKLSDVDYPGYHITLDLEVRNLGKPELHFAYRLDGPNGMPIEGWWYANKIGRTWGAVGIRDVIARYEGADTVQFGPATIANDDVEPMLGRPLAFIGVDAQYFSSVLVPNKQSPDEIWIEEARTLLLGTKPEKTIEGRYANVTCRLISHPSVLASGGELKHSYTIFTGPKRPDLLANYQASGSDQSTLGDLLYYGWFSAVAKAMLGILHFFYGIVGNYGIAIVLLTTLVRGCLFPLSRKQAQSMARMQELRPEMDKIKEKYKNDMQKQSQATQELYRMHKINPMAGCMPMFIQLPILLGLYRSLMVDVELRQAPLISESIRWCSNLAAPDMLFNWSSMMPSAINSGEGILGLGPYLNVLPLVTIVFFLLQQKMFMPEAANEQAAMQQKIMKYMMIFMGLLFFKVAAGLCIYFIATSIWSIAERKCVPPTPKPDAAASSSASLAQARPGSGRNGQSKSKKQRSTKSKKKR